MCTFLEFFWQDLLPHVKEFFVVSVNLYVWVLAACDVNPDVSDCAGVLKKSPKQQAQVLSARSADAVLAVNSS